MLSILQEAALYKLSVYLKEIGRQELLDKYSSQFELTLLQNNPSNYRETLRLAAIGNTDFDEVRCCHLLSLLQNEPISITMLELCITEAAQPFLSRMLSELEGFYGISFEFAFRVTCSVVEADFDDYTTLHGQFEYLTALLLPQPSEKLFFCQPLIADERLFAYVSQNDEQDKHLEGICELCACKDSAPIYAGEEYLPQIEQQLSDFDRPKAMLQIIGADGVGKRFLLKAACQHRGVGILLTNWSIILEREDAEIPRLMQRVIREALFYHFAICLYGLTEENAASQKSVEKLVRLALRPIRRMGIKTILLTEAGVNIHPYDFSFIGRVEIKIHTRNERITYWECFCRQYGLKTHLDCVSYASNFVLSPCEIEKAVLDLVYQERSNLPITDEVVAKACYNAIKLLQQGNIKKITTTYTLDDLKLPVQQKQALKNICAHLKHRHLVYDEWNMESRFAYGKNISALFVGPPGTGKTMAVHVLAKMMGLPLYRIDLSQVVDKYIGETEKRLEAIFTAAEKSNSILFFDEADSIFGKRSEVNDSKDKYANTEVSYILQRIEQYDGVVILASNYKKNIDEAFMRRMRYLVEFQMPGEELRRELWQSSFAPQVPLENIDFPYLARQFELAGGAIKNIALNATFLAADAEHAVTMKDILDSVRGENLKMGKTMLAQDFAEYSALQR